MDRLTSPFLRALVSMLGMQGATLAVGGARIGRRPWFIPVVLVLVTVGRVVLVLPFCAQPRLADAPWHPVVGVALMLLALLVGEPAPTIRWWRPPATGTALRTRGVYAIGRHPIYLAEVLWPIGWSLVWGSVIGLLLTPLWWLGFLLHALAEEERMEAVLGEEYREYAREVRGRILPGLPM